MRDWGERVAGQTLDGPFETQDAPVRLPSAPNVDDLSASSPGPQIDSISEIPDIPPSLYARFESFELLGRGAMGVVYQARDIRIGREVAIKLLFGADPEHGGGLLREVRSLARIEHPNVCEVYDAGIADHVRFIVMQRIRGDSFDKAQETMTLEEKVHIVRDIAFALHEAHRKGVLHRDVKPSNIMIERTDDGAWKPYMMDFGLAREMGDSGATVTGVVAGTPAYMAPEQAEGRVRSLDRRTDVYSLGASLFHVLSGRPPFVAEHVGTLLSMIILDEPARLGDVLPGVAADLEAIVMKCLERDPSRRYESAKALGDDLQRFLDGEPVEARPRSLPAILLSHAKRHRGKLLLGVSALFVALIFLGLWLRAREVAAIQAQLSRRLGESVKDVEWLLRNAHGMPLHDVDRERDVVRKRLAEIQTQMVEAGDLATGPGHYALGRGYLALQDPVEALEHLEQAHAAGYRGPALRLAMGMAMTSLYEKALVETKRIEGAERKKERIAVIEATYKKPALEHLRAALGGTVEAPSYTEGLIALYEERYSDALTLAQQAFDQTPWLYEAKLLEGKVHFARGSKFGHDAAFDYDKMVAEFDQAAAAYQVAADIGSSDPAVRLARCELLTQRMNGDRAHGKVLRPSFEAARKECSAAIAASPKSGVGYMMLAQVHAFFAWHVAAGQAKDESPEKVIVEALEHAENAARRNPDEPMGRFVVASLWRTRALYASDRGLDAMPLIDHAVEAYQQAIQLDSAFVWALNELCSSLSMRGRQQALRGVDPAATFTQAIAACDQASEIEPTFVFPRLIRIAIRKRAADFALAMGRAPDEYIRAAQEALQDLIKKIPQHGNLGYWYFILHQIEAASAIERGKDPTEALRRAEEITREKEQKHPDSIDARQFRGELSLMQAKWQLKQGRDPGKSVEVAREAFRKTIEANPWDLGYRVGGAEAEIVALRWAADHEEPLEADRFTAARAILKPLLDQERFDPRFYQALAEIDEIEALEMYRRKKDPSFLRAKALSWIEKALAVNPKSKAALEAKKRLLEMKMK